MSKIWVLEHFCGNCSNFLHEGRRQFGTSSEFGGILGKNLNLGLIRGLNRDEALFQSF